jgi:hypothetical protein
VGVGSLGSRNVVLCEEVVGRVPRPDVLGSCGSCSLIGSREPDVCDVRVLRKQKVVVRPQREETGLHAGD